MIQKACKLLLLVGVVSCSKHVKPTSYYSNDFKNGGVERHDGLGFEIPVKYDIDVVYFNDHPKQSYEDIETIKMSGEVPLDEKQTQNGKMLYRGNHQDKKQEILTQMVEKAKELGASALIDVKYSVYSTQTASGFTFTGKAVRYVLK
ncbi:heavy metal-binding domain-containing protein [Aquirufa sp. A-Brett2-15D]